MSFADFARTHVPLPARVRHVGGAAEDLRAAGYELDDDAKLLVAEVCAWERMDEPTRDWFDRQRSVLAAAGRNPPPVGPAATDLLDGYEERASEWGPILYRYLDGVTGESLERTLIEAGAIVPLGFRFVGERP